MQSTAEISDLCIDKAAQLCAEDPDGAGPITGGMVLEEDVRQLCIHQLTKVKRGDLNYREGDQVAAGVVEYAEKFWNYVERFPAACPLDGDEGRRFGRECSEDLMLKLGIDVGRVRECSEDLMLKLGIDVGRV